MGNGEHNMKNLTIENIVKACEGTLYGTEFIKEGGREAAGVVLDSRLLQENYVLNIFLQ